MPKFRITTTSGATPEHHEAPVEFPDEKSAIDDAQVALAEMARDALPDGKRANFGVTLRDEGGKTIYDAHMDFAARDATDLEREEAEAEDAARTVLEALRKAVF